MLLTTGRQHGRNYDYELVLINETLFSRPRPKAEVSRPRLRPRRVDLEAPRVQDRDMATTLLAGVYLWRRTVRCVRERSLLSSVALLLVVSFTCDASVVKVRLHNDAERSFSAAG